MESTVKGTLRGEGHHQEGSFVTRSPHPSAVQTLNRRGIDDVTVWTVPDEALELRRERNREEVFSFYGRLDLFLRGPAAFAAEVAEYFWPQVARRLR